VPAQLSLTTGARLHSNRLNVGVNKVLAEHHFMQFIASWVVIRRVSDIVCLRQTYIIGKKPLLSAYNRRSFG